MGSDVLNASARPPLPGVPHIPPPRPSSPHAAAPGAPHLSLRSVRTFEGARAALRPGAAPTAAVFGARRYAGMDAHVRPHTHTCSHAHADTQIHGYARTHTCIHISIHRCPYPYMHICAHIYPYTPIHTHACVRRYTYIYAHTSLYTHTDSVLSHPTAEHSSVPHTRTWGQGVHGAPGGCSSCWAPSNIKHAVMLDTNVCVDCVHACIHLHSHIEAEM